MRLSAVLTLVTLVSGLAIAFTWERTKSGIEEQERTAEKSALESVFPDGVEIKKMEGAPPLPLRYWIALRDSMIAGYAFQDSSRGFEKDIKIVVGVAPDGTVLGMNILSQSETPGLGSRTQEVASKKYLWNAFAGNKEEAGAWFTMQFAGLNVLKDISIVKSAEWHLLGSDKRRELTSDNAVTAITGATISTRAVVRAVSKSVPRYLDILTSERNGQ